MGQVDARLDCLVVWLVNTPLSSTPRLISHLIQRSLTAAHQFAPPRPHSRCSPPSQRSSPQCSSHHLLTSSFQFNSIQFFSVSVSFESVPYIPRGSTEGSSGWAIILNKTKRKQKERMYSPRILVLVFLNSRPFNNSIIRLHQNEKKRSVIKWRPRLTIRVCSRRPQTCVQCLLHPWDGLAHPLAVAMIMVGMTTAMGRHQQVQPPSFSRPSFRLVRSKASQSTRVASVCFIRTTCQ
jgi:hypothetical protein